MPISSKNTLCFFLCGVCTIMPTMIFFFATQDILAGTVYPSSLVVLVCNLSEVAVLLVVPWIIYRVPFTASFLAGSTLAAIATLLAVSIDSIPVRIAGAGVIGMVFVLNVCLFTAMAARLPQTTELAAAFQVGRNSGCIGVIYYTVMTVSACATPRVTVACTFSVIVVFIFVYAIIDRHQMDDANHEGGDHKDIEYHALTNSLNDDIPEDVERIWHRPLRIMWKVLPICLCLHVGFFCFYISQFSILTTLAFPSAPFSPENHFKFNVLTAFVSRLIGGADLVIVSRFCPAFLPYFRIKRLWVLPFLQCLHVLLFIFASWYRFVPHVGIILTLSFTIGYLTGSLVVNGTLNASDEFESPTEKGIAMGMTLWGNSIGSILAGVEGLSLEKDLRQHCQEVLLLGKYCFTRTQNTKGWTSGTC